MGKTTGPARTVACFKRLVSDASLVGDLDRDANLTHVSATVPGRTAILNRRHLCRCSSKAREQPRIVDVRLCSWTQGARRAYRTLQSAYVKGSLTINERRCDPPLNLAGDLRVA
jgi:hypothetical protein